MGDWVGPSTNKMSFRLATGKTVVKWTKHIFLLCLAIGIVCPLARAEPFYKGRIRLEVDLYTKDGVRLEKGRYGVEVRPDKDHDSLAFLSDGKVKAAVNGHMPPEDGRLPATILLMGTEYLRSSEDPELTVEERHFSKTGQPQYQEENRDWKATLRAFKSEDNTRVFFVFHERKADGKWRRVDFKLRLKPAAPAPAAP